MPRPRRSCRTTARTAADAGRRPRSGVPDRGRDPRHPAGSHNRSRHRFPRVPRVLRHPRIGGAIRGIPPAHTTDRDTNSRQARGTRKSGSLSAASRRLTQPIATPIRASPAAPANQGPYPQHPAASRNRSRHPFARVPRHPQIRVPIRSIPPPHATDRDTHSRESRGTRESGAQSAASRRLTQPIATPIRASPATSANQGRNPQHPAASRNRSRHQLPPVPRHPQIRGATRGIPPPHTTDRDTDSRGVCLRPVRAGACGSARRRR
ncbi:hypothetical protein OR221_1493 [Microbacterium laevaniformans OR221]|nr:hypothetical protein OR221_1493 [Microbacterium laevaniformans OR221]